MSSIDITNRLDAAETRALLSPYAYAKRVVSDYMVTVFAIRGSIHRYEIQSLDGHVVILKTRAEAELALAA